MALADQLAPHYGDDWWFLCQLAFAQMESGNYIAAEPNIERALAGNPAMPTAHTTALTYTTKWAKRMRAMPT